MKIAYSHLVRHIQENPSLEMVSARLFQLGHEHEVEGDIFNIEFTPNRGDCLSVDGLLRDLSVFYNINLNNKIYSEKLDKLKIDFKNLSQDICPQISFLKLEIDKIPDTYNDCLNDYFLDLNLNKNNFFTDISNYISYETGQPTHCYDANKINGKLTFNHLDIHQEFESLLGKKINLTNENSVFLLNDEVINLAGVVGGKETSCTIDTKVVLLECAFFQPEAIIGKSIKYDIQSEASHKFERFVDPSCQERVIRRFINLVKENTNIKNMSFVSFKFKQNQVIKIPINVNKINQIVGINIKEDQYLNYLSKLGFVVNDRLIEVPSYRNDILTQNDLAEEIARIIGYDNIAKHELTIPAAKKLSNHDIENKLRYFLLDQGFYEVINSPFVKSISDSSIKVDNPLDSNREYLRTNITESLLDNLIFNEKRQKDSIKLFEISDIYTSQNNEIHKKRMLGIVASGRMGHNHKDFSKKINKNYLTETFKELLPAENFNFQTISRDGLHTKIKNDIIGCEVNIDDFSSKLLKYNETATPPLEFVQYSPISDLPYSMRDLSFSVKDFSKCKELEEYVFKFEDDLLKKVFIFDYFHSEKNEEIKVGIRFVFQSTKSTVTDKDINKVMKKIIDQCLTIESISIPGLSIEQ